MEGYAGEALLYIFLHVSLRGLLDMMTRRLIIMAVFTALMVAPILGQQYAMDQAAGAQVSSNASITSALNVTPVTDMAAGVNVIITNVSSLGDEWVTIANQGDTPVNLGGWALTDGTRFRYIFPSMVIPVGSAIRIHFGHGFNVGQDIYLDLSGDMLPDSGGAVMLYDNSGTMVSSYAYPGMVQQVLPTNGAVFPGTEVQPVEQVQRGVLVAPGEFSPAARGEQIVPNATSTYVTQLANVSVIFETNRAFNVNVTNVGIMGDEFIQVTNEGSVPVNLSGWMLTVASTNFAYPFPMAVLPIGEFIRVHPGPGTSTQRDLYLNLTQPVLNDLSDVVTLFNSEGTMISRYTYPGGPSSLIAAPETARTPGTEPILFGNVTPGITAGPSPSGEAFLQAPVQPLPNATVGQVQQVIVGPGS
jgi:hypothetical protein